MTLHALFAKTWPRMKNSRMSLPCSGWRSCRARIDARSTALVAWSAISRNPSSPPSSSQVKQDVRVPLEESLDGFEQILDDEFADYSERSLYMIGSVEEARQYAE